MTKLNTLIVFNPVAGGGKKLDLSGCLEKHLDSGRYDYRIAYTQYAGHGYELASDAAGTGVDLVVAVGGDGLINEIARGVINSNTAMGIIPYGSGNGFARHLKIPLKPVKAIEVLNHFHTAGIDTFIINDNRLFCNMAGTGFDALVAEKFAGSKQRGLSTYVKIILKEFIKFSPREYTLTINDKDITLRAFMISFANSGQFGNNAVIAPMASVTDGLLDVCVMKGFRWYQAPHIGFMLLTGRIDKTSFMTYFKTAGVKLKLPGDEPCHLDGDPFDLGNQLHIKLNRSSLKVVVPDGESI